MARAELAETSAVSSRSPAKAEYPVREYIGSMAQELAEMARWDGDEVLAGLLETVALRAESPRP
ncbi:hypothetical protein [Brevundimonas sp.]|jgi:hypothetical protein|uniref:hypothetical protein n=1 Tax=Brevundimonas sp. TaxID=1871086 RepID=UPI003783888A